GREHARRIPCEPEPAVLTIRQKKNGFAARSISKKIGGREINSLINERLGGVCYLRKLGRRERRLEQTAIARKRQQQMRLGRKGRDCYFIFRLERPRQGLRYAAHRAEFPINARTRIDDKGDARGRGGGIEGADLLLRAILPHAKIIPGKS